MTNKQQIQKLRDNAELAMASYGYFHLIGKKIKNDEDECGDKANKPITLHDILDITYKNYETQDSTFFNTENLKGDFTHAFLGLTKGKSPDELDKIDKELRDKKLKNVDWKDFDKKWYETMDTNEYNNGFWGFGMGVSGVCDVAGKVFKYNQYAIRENL